MKALLKKIAQLRVLVVGDILLDHYIWGDASRLSQEAPVPVVAVERDTYAAGGAANVALNLRALGCQAEICGVVGDDDSGRKLLNMLNNQGVDFDKSFTVKGAETILKTRVIVRQQQLCRVDREREPSHYAFVHKKHIPVIEDKTRRADAVIISDYAKGVIDETVIKAVQKVAAEKGVPVAYDPKPKRQLDVSELDLMTPNLAEALDLAGIELSDRTVAKLLKKMDFSLRVNPMANPLPVMVLS